MLRGCFQDVLWAFTENVFPGSFKECFKEVSRKFKWCSKKVSRLLQVRSKGVSHIFEGVSRVFERTLKVLSGKF